MTHDTYKAKQLEILERLYAIGQEYESVREAAQALDALMLEVVGSDEQAPSGDLTRTGENLRNNIWGRNKLRASIRSVVKGGDEVAK